MAPMDIRYGTAIEDIRRGVSTVTGEDVKVDNVYKYPEGKCGSLDNQGIKYIRITKISGDGTLYYKACERDGRLISCRYEACDSDACEAHACYRCISADDLGSRVGRGARLKERHKDLAHGLQVGMKVRTNGDGGGITEEFTGIVEDIGDEGIYIRRDDGQTGGGVDGTWTIRRDNNTATLSILTKKKSLMTKVNVMMKKLLDKDTQTLVKAGYIDGDLELTDEGEEALDAILFQQHKAELVTLAKEQLAEESD